MDDVTMRAIGQNMCVLAQEIQELGVNLQGVNSGNCLLAQSPSEQNEASEEMCQEVDENNNKMERTVYRFSNPTIPTRDNEQNLAGGQDPWQISKEDVEEKSSITDLQNTHPSPGSQSEHAEHFNVSSETDSDCHTKITKRTTKTTTVQKTLVKKVFGTNTEVGNDTGSSDEDMHFANKLVDELNTCEMPSVHDSSTDSQDDESSTSTSSSGDDDISRCAHCGCSSSIMDLESTDEETDCEGLDGNSDPGDKTPVPMPPICFTVNIDVPQTSRHLPNDEDHGQWRQARQVVTNCNNFREAPTQDIPTEAWYSPNPRIFRQVVDVSGYRPEDIEVVITDGVVAIRANHVEFDKWPETGVNMYSDGFCDCYALPAGVEPDSVKMSFTHEGMLVIEALLPPRI